LQTTAECRLGRGSEWRAAQSLQTKAGLETLRMSEDAVLKATHRVVSERRSRCRCFSLPELLVVATIIMIMFAMLLPALKEARNVALVAVCMHNMRQCYIGLSNHDANNQHLPTAKGLTGYASPTNYDEPSSYIRLQNESRGLGLLVEGPNASLVESMFCVLSDFNSRGAWGVETWDNASLYTISWVYRGVRDEYKDPDTGDSVYKHNIAQFEDYSEPDKKAVLIDWNQTRSWTVISFPPYDGRPFSPVGESHNLRNSNVTYGDGHVNLKNNVDDGGYPLPFQYNITGTPYDVDSILDCFGVEDNEDNFDLGDCP
jgi:prepilin-type processing-associated H-X9-DG protein